MVSFSAFMCFTPSLRGRRLVRRSSEPRPRRDAVAGGSPHKLCHNRGSPRVRMGMYATIRITTNSAIRNGMMARTISENRAAGYARRDEQYEPHRRCGEAHRHVEAHHDGEVHGGRCRRRAQPAAGSAPGSGSPAPRRAPCRRRSRKTLTSSMKTSGLSEIENRRSDSMRGMPAMATTWLKPVETPTSSSTTPRLDRRALEDAPEGGEPRTRPPSGARP